MKAARHAMIQEIVENNEIKTQEELAQALRARGVSVTQATVSRDIKALRLLKVLSKDGGYKYATADKAQSGMAERFIRIFHDSVLSVAQANNLLVLKTISGSAHVAGEAIDTLHWPEIVGHHLRRQHHPGYFAGRDGGQEHPRALPWHDALRGGCALRR